MNPKLNQFVSGEVNYLLAQAVKMQYAVQYHGPDSQEIKEHIKNCKAAIRYMEDVLEIKAHEQEK